MHVHLVIDAYASIQRRRRRRIYLQMHVYLVIDAYASIHRHSIYLYGGTPLLEMARFAEHVYLFLL